MMKVFGNGRLTADARVTTEQDGSFVASFSVAVNGWHNQQKTVDYYNCWWRIKGEGKRLSWLTKGIQVTVLGDLRTNVQQDESGRRTTSFYLLLYGNGAVEFPEGKPEGQPQVPVGQFGGAPTGPVRGTSYPAPVPGAFVPTPGTAPGAPAYATPTMPQHGIPVSDNPFRPQAPPRTEAPGSVSPSPVPTGGYMVPPPPPVG